MFVSNCASSMLQIILHACSPTAGGPPASCRSLPTTTLYFTCKSPEPTNRQACTLLLSWLLHFHSWPGVVPRWDCPPSCTTVVPLLTTLLWLSTQLLQRASLTSRGCSVCTASAATAAAHDQHYPCSCTLKCNARQHLSRASAAAHQNSNSNADAGKAA